MGEKVGIQLHAMQPDQFEALKQQMASTPDTPEKAEMLRRVAPPEIAVKGAIVSTRKYTTWQTVLRYKLKVVHAARYVFSFKFEYQSHPKVRITAGNDEFHCNSSLPAAPHDDWTIYENAVLPCLDVGEHIVTIDICNRGPKQQSKVKNLQLSMFYQEGLISD